MILIGYTAASYMLIAALVGWYNDRRRSRHPVRAAIVWPLWIAVLLTTLLVVLLSLCCLVAGAVFGQLDRWLSRLGLWACGEEPKRFTEKSDDE